MHFFNLVQFQLQRKTQHDNRHRSFHGCHLYIFGAMENSLADMFWPCGPSSTPWTPPVGSPAYIRTKQVIHDYRATLSKSERTLKCFLTMAITVLQFRLKEVMTRQHNFVLKCIKFYRSFCKQSYDETTQACKKITKYPNGKKAFNFELFL